MLLYFIICKLHENFVASTVIYNSRYVPSSYLATNATSQTSASSAAPVSSSSSVRVDGKSLLSYGVNPTKNYLKAIHLSSSEVDKGSQLDVGLPGVIIGRNFLWWSRLMGVRCPFLDLGQCTVACRNMTERRLLN